MREIKFRAWDKRFKNMVYSSPMAILNMNDSDHEIMQYTGLKDKNGKEIYEGDVVSVKPKNITHRGVVKFVDGSYIYEEDGKIFAQASYLGTPSKKGEIIGNIYENPDLVEPLGDYNGCGSDHDPHECPKL